MHRNSIPLFEKFLATPRSQNWRILIYSGDFDAAVPFLGSQKWVHCLGRKVKKDWREWNFNKQFAGAVIDYDGITFMTVHGSGHAIPWYTPALGYEFFHRWIQDQPFYACIVKPFVAWSFTIIFGYIAIRVPDIKAIAWRLVAVFVIYGLGDIVMEMGTALTPVGIVFFFCGHVVYLRSVVLARDAPSEKDVDPVMNPTSRKILAGVCSFLVFATTTYAVTCVYRSSHLFLFCVAAEIYAQMFSFATIIGSLKWRRGISMALTIFGSFIYAASDICIATQRYITQVWWMSPFIMVTYWGALFCYASSFFPVVLHAVEKAEKPKDKEQ